MKMFTFFDNGFLLTSGAFVKALKILKINNPRRTKLKNFWYTNEPLVTNSCRHNHIEKINIMS